MISKLHPKLRAFLEIKSIKQLTRFLITGTASTVINYIAFLTFLRGFDLHYLIANIAAFLVSITFSYNFNKRWSFGGPHQKSSHIVEYLCVYVGSLALSSIILKITVDFMGIIPEVAYILALCVTTCTNFLGIKFFVFKK